MKIAMESAFLRIKCVANLFEQLGGSFAAHHYLIAFHAALPS
jgi:hypothetical protein